MRLRPLVNAALLAIACAAAGCAPRPAQVCFGSACVRAEVADTEPLRQKGLMFRQGLDEGEGMLFVFETPGRWGFWMKNMRFPIDIVWLDARGAVVSVREGALPCKDACLSWYPTQDASYVLEVPAGYCAHKGVRVGSKARIILPAAVSRRQ